MHPAKIQIYRDLYFSVDLKVQFCYNAGRKYYHSIFGDGETESHLGMCHPLCHTSQRKGRNLAQGFLLQFESLSLFKSSVLELRLLNQTAGDQFRPSCQVVSDVFSCLNC